MSDSVLAVTDLVSKRGHNIILQGVSFEVSQGVVGLIGRNGMGKTTLAESIMGILSPFSGSVKFNGIELCGKKSNEIARSGIALVPQGRRLFKSLTVQEHLTMMKKAFSGKPDYDVLELFPRLSERLTNRASQLSGGEQQMLAIARALLQNPKILIMDEPSEGLAPVIVDELSKIISKLAQQDMPILLIEQNLSLVEKTVNGEVFIMDNGRIANSISVSTLASDKRVQERILGVSVGA